MAATLSRWPTNSILARLATTRRAATVTDRAFACRTHHLAYRDVVERQFGAWVEEQQDGFFQSSWAAQPHEIILFEGEPCGYVCVDDRPADVHLRELVLAPHYQGQGIGSAVLDAVIEHANARRVRSDSALISRSGRPTCIAGWLPPDRQHGHAAPVRMDCG